MKKFWYSLDEEGQNTESEDMAEVDEALTHASTNGTKGKERSIQESVQSEPETPSTIPAAQVAQRIMELDFSVTRRKPGRPQKKRKVIPGHLADSPDVAATPAKDANPKPSTLAHGQTAVSGSTLTARPSSVSFPTTLKRKRSIGFSAAGIKSNVEQRTGEQAEAPDTPRLSFPNSFSSSSAPAPPRDSLEPRVVSFFRKPKGFKLPGRLDDS